MSITLASKQTSYSLLQTTGFAGQLRSGADAEILAMINAETVLSMPFGAAVKFGGGTYDNGAKVLTAITEKVAGLVVQTHGYDREFDLDATGVIFGNMINVLRKGRILVPCEDGCVPGNRLHIRALIGSGSFVGALRATADSSNTIDSTNQGVWLTTAAALGLAVLEVDFTASPNIGS